MCNDEDSMTVTSVVSNSMLSNSIDATCYRIRSMPSNSIGAMLSNSIATTIEFDRRIAIEFDAIEFDRRIAIEFDPTFHRHHLSQATTVWYF